MLYNKPYDQTNPAAGYVNGNPATNTAGSIPCAEGLEYPQREIVNAITAAGLTPTNSDLTQLAQAIAKIAAANGTTIVQAAKAPFNYQPLTSTAHTSATGSQAGVFTQVLSGLTFKKKSPTSNVVISANFSSHAPVQAGQGNGAVTFRLNLGGSYYDEALLNSSFLAANGAPTGGGSNTPTFFITGAPAGNLAITAGIKRDDSAPWSTIFNPNSGDVSGLQATPLVKFFGYEVEPNT